MLDRRLHILLDEPRYCRVEAAARARGTSVAAIIREAIDYAVPADLERKRAAWEALRAAEPMPVPATVEELKADCATPAPRSLIVVDTSVLVYAVGGAHPLRPSASGSSTRSRRVTWLGGKISQCPGRPGEAHPLAHDPAQHQAEASD